jgi:HK97 family phage major capsid protein
MAEVEKRIATAGEAGAKAIADLQGELAAKSAEILAMQNSKMKFAAPAEGLYKEKETAYLLAKMAGKRIEDTAYGRSVIEKAGPHVPSATWELEVSRNMEAEIRRRLVVAPTLRQIEMQTNVMTMPVNPEAGAATWVTNAQFGTTNSMGAAQTHQLKEITLNAYKVATAEYMNYEEQEDSLLILLPVVRDAMVRRVAKAVDKAFLLGAGSGADPVKGLAAYDTASAVVGAVATKITVANMIALRRDLGTWGLDPSELIYIVNNDVYYDLLEDTTFQTVDKIGDRATLLTGQIGSIGNTPVIVSGSLPSKVAGAAGALTNVGAIVYHPGNFIVGNQRGLRFDTQDLVETQRKVMVASLRTGMTQVTTNEGIAISALRYTT